jgi:ABC-type lipoprotein release transport system permease subunit
MKTLLKMAWLNIWRNKRRAVILLCSMTAGLVGVLLSMALALGWIHQLKENAVRTYEGHLKVFAQGYHLNPVVDHHLDPSPALSQWLDRDPRVKAWAERVAVDGLLSTPTHSVVVRIVGIDPDRERHVSILADAVQEGRFLSAAEPHQILVSRRLADKLQKGTGKKVVLLSQQLGDELGSGAFRIGGIFDTGNGAFDGQTVCILKTEAQQMLKLSNQVTEVVAILRDMRESEACAAELAALVRGEPVEVLTWKEQLPFVAQVIEFSNRIMLPYYGIFYIAMAFGIMNTLLMAIGERTHEIGVMMAIGLGRGRLVGLILLESAFLALVAILVSSLLTWLLVSWWKVKGINLSVLAAGMDYLGVGRILYPFLDVPHVVAAVLAALGVTVAFSVYPAARAARLVPVEAIRRLK